LRVTGRSLLCALALTSMAIGSDGAQSPELPFDQAKALAELRKSIEGQEDKPAVDVFMNITQYKGVTAERLLRIMEFGFTKSLGVNCTHCHVPGKWDSDEKGAKETARAMSRMVIAINSDYLKTIPSLNSANPSVNCTTCHRGQKRPALEMPEPPPVAPATREGKP
jgi:Photosynthetic reaction centre cytochrome C subunit